MREPRRARWKPAPWPWLDESIELPDMSMRWSGEFEFGDGVLELRPLDCWNDCAKESLNETAGCRLLKESPGLGRGLLR